LRNLTFVAESVSQQRLKKRIVCSDPREIRKSLEYSKFGIAVDRSLTVKWLFPQEKATFQCTKKGYTNSEFALARVRSGVQLLVKKAVITAAARSQRALPLQTLIDGDSNEKSLLRILIEQSLAAGAEEIAVVVCPGDETAYAQSAGPQASSVRFIAQDEPRGYGHAIHCARSFTSGDPFLHMVGDHLYVSTAAEPSAKRVVELAQKERCSVSGVHLTRESQLSRYGTVGGRRIPQRSDLYRVDTVIEKPTPTEAEQRLLISGIRAGHYLCFCGIHVFTPTVMEILDRMLAASSDANVTLVDALAALARQEQYLAIEDDGRRYDLGAPFGLLIAQLALALSGRNRSEVLAQMLELLADRELAGNGGGATS
jgi:UTP--glucose-1-phosphate uridylyltransferase